MSCHTSFFITEKLQMDKFCDITSRNELADFLKVPRSKLTHILYVKKVDSCYTSFEIPKKNGETRKINAPSDELKSIQRKLAAALVKYQIDIRREQNIRSNISHGFEKDKSILTNAKIHRNKRFLVNIDLENFFDSFHFGRVKGFFENNKDFALSREVAVVIAQLTCYKGTLPQGAPTSPVITNLICNILDNRLLKISKKYKLDYTRYADDLTFSTNRCDFLDYKKQFMEELEKEINRAGFRINDKKTRILFRDSQQIVTGLVVNKKLNVAREYYKKTKAMAHTLYTEGKFTIDGEEGAIEQLEGRFSFINQLDKYNNKLDGNLHEQGNLNGREREYKRFLFYKYFFGNEKPLIVTEGKTDIRYIKSALKNLHKEYPALICKKGDEFEYKVDFLKRSKRLEYFLGIRTDGADTLQNIYKYFIDNNIRERKRFPNYFEYFIKMGSKPNCPVMLAFDNELESKKPLKKFIQEFKISSEKIGKLKEHLFLRLEDNKNIYLFTNPVVSGKGECEIEDLFSQEVLCHEIDGKRFCAKDHFDPNEFYGKEIFSQYIALHYNQIDFSCFKPMLDAINTIVMENKK